MITRRLALKVSKLFYKQKLWSDCDNVEWREATDRSYSRERLMISFLQLLYSLLTCSAHCVERAAVSNFFSLQFFYYDVYIKFIWCEWGSCGGEGRDAVVGNFCKNVIILQLKIRTTNFLSKLKHKYKKLWNYIKFYTFLSI